jgi:hypothetical protein
VRLGSIILCFLGLLAMLSGRRAAADEAGLAALLQSFITPEGIGWEQLDQHREVRWSVPNPVMLKSVAPDGSSFARPGVATFGGRTLSVAASGARAGVASLYVSEPVAAAPADAVAEGLRRAGLGVAPARCPRNPAAADPWRGWYHLTSRRGTANLFIGRLKSGEQGYTLYLADLPPMTQEQAARFVDCAAGPAGGGAAAATGQAGLVAAIEAVLRPAGAPATLPWGAPIPAVRWLAPAPQKIGRPPYSAGGADSNPMSLSGTFKTATTEMSVTATGNTAGANRFYFEGGGNLPRGAVFEGLQRHGYGIAAVTCGKPYTRMSENWFRIAAPGRQPAILYRSMSVSTGQPTETYAVWLDNVPPSLLPGQRPAGGGTCPG